MDLRFLAFLADPWFVIPWYAVPVPATLWEAYDVHKVNRRLDQAQKWAWPIIIFFFSIIGLAFCAFTGRPSGIGKIKDHEQQKKVSHQYSRSEFRKITSSVIHCGRARVGANQRILLKRWE